MLKNLIIENIQNQIHVRDKGNIDECLRNDFEMILKVVPVVQ